MPSNHLTLCHPLLLLPSILPSIRVFFSEPVLRIRWPKYWSFSSGISLSSEYSGLISFRIDWFDLRDSQICYYCATLEPLGGLYLYKYILSVSPCDILSAEYIIIKVFTLAIKQLLPGSNDLHMAKPIVLFVFFSNLTLLDFSKVTDMFVQSYFGFKNTIIFLFLFL